MHSRYIQCSKGSRGARFRVGKGQNPSRTFSHPCPPSTSSLDGLQEANQLQTPTDHLGGNCKSNQPLILVGVHALSFHAKQETTSLPALLFSSQFIFFFLPPSSHSSSLRLHLPCNCNRGYFLSHVEKNQDAAAVQCKRNGTNRTT